MRTIALLINLALTEVCLLRLGVSGVTSLAAGNYHTVALRQHGTLWAWGYNLYGQLGDVTTQRSSPVQVTGF